MKPNTGLVLTGGGARGAYQAGVLQGIAEITAKYGNKPPFSIISGASAGALNGAFVAASIDDFQEAAPRLAAFWGSLRSREIFRTDVRSLSRIGIRFLSDLAFGGMKKTKDARSLLDTTPLRHLIAANIPFDRIRRNINLGLLRACEISALDYDTSENVSFIMTNDPGIKWITSRRRSIHAEINLDHVMASAAIPLIFPPVSFNARHFGDGCVRNPSPLSPAIRLGSQRLVIIGVRHGRDLTAPLQPAVLQPTIGRILSVLLNAVLMDSVEYDIERLTRLNQTVRQVPTDIRSGLPLREVGLLCIQPSVDLGALAAEQFQRLPDPIRHLIKGLGSKAEASELVSYLLFEPAYCGSLAQIGREDALKRRDEIEAFLLDPAV